MRRREGHGNPPSTLTINRIFIEFLSKSKKILFVLKSFSYCVFAISWIDLVVIQKQITNKFILCKFHQCDLLGILSDSLDIKTK